MPPRKKINVETPTALVEPSASVAVASEVQQHPIVVKQKRERKSSKHPVVAVVSQNGIQGIFQPEIRRPLIAHLPITSNEVKFYNQPLHYDPNPPTKPEAYDANMTNPFA